MVKSPFEVIYRPWFFVSTAVVVLPIFMEGIVHPQSVSVKTVHIDGGEEMKRRFSAQQLYQLRNSIPIDVLIEQKLLIPCKHSEGFFRFLCPLCGEFQTATMKKTNLARCFRCEKNFNTIDMVMLCTNTDFVESVNFLITYLQNLTAKRDPLATAPKECPRFGESLENFPLRPTNTVSLKATRKRSTTMRRKTGPRQTNPGNDIHDLIQAEHKNPKDREQLKLRF